MTILLSPYIMSHNFKGTEVNDKIVISGSFDINLWYSYDNDTKTTVITKKIEYNENVSVKQKYSTDSSSKDIIVRSLKQPNCINARSEGNVIYLEIEKELGIEIVGDTKVKIAIEEDEEPWDLILDDDINSKIDSEIDNSVNVDYIKEETKDNN